MTDIEQTVKRIVSESLGVKESDITEESSFVDDLGADSLDLVELMMALDAARGVDIPDEEASKIVTVGDAIKAVKQKLSVN